jgi:hypothetical protein
MPSLSQAGENTILHYFNSSEFLKMSQESKKLSLQMERLKALPQLIQETEKTSLRDKAVAILCCMGSVVLVAGAVAYLAVSMFFPYPAYLEIPGTVFFLSFALGFTALRHTAEVFGRSSLLKGELKQVTGKLARFDLAAFGLQRESIVSKAEKYLKGVLEGKEKAFQLLPLEAQISRSRSQEKNELEQLRKAVSELSQMHRTV